MSISLTLSTFPHYIYTQIIFIYLTFFSAMVSCDSSHIIHSESVMPSLRIKEIARCLSATQRLTFSGLLLGYSYENIALLRERSIGTIKIHTRVIREHLPSLDGSDDPIRLKDVPSRIQSLHTASNKNLVPLIMIEDRIPSVLRGISTHGHIDDKMHSHAACQTLLEIAQGKTEQEILTHLQNDTELSVVGYAFEKRHVLEYMLAIALILYSEGCTDVSLNQLRQHIYMDPRQDS